MLTTPFMVFNVTCVMCVTIPSFEVYVTLKAALHKESRPKVGNLF